MPQANESFNIGLNSTQIKYFERKVWKQLRTRSLADQLAANDGSSVVHRVTELKNTTWGYSAVMTLNPDDTSFGVVGDNRLEDNEVGLDEHQLEITFDQFRKAFKNEGRMADRSSWIDFSKQASDQLAWWAIDIKDRLFINTLSGIAYDIEVDGSARDSQFSQLRFAGDVVAPSANRHLRWDKTNGLVGPSASTSDVAADDFPTWDTFIEMRAELPLMRVKPLRGKWGDGSDLYIALVHPRTLTLLKKDTKFRENYREAMSRSENHVFFKGAEAYMIEGFLVIAHRYVYSTLGAASGSKWGGGSVNGTRTLFLGAQALGMVEMGSPIWETDERDFKNHHAVSMALKFGYRKTRWPDQYAGGSEEDFGVVCLDHAIPTGATSYTV